MGESSYLLISMFITAVSTFSHNQHALPQCTKIRDAWSRGDKKKKAEATVHNAAHNGVAARPDGHGTEGRSPPRSD